MYFQSHRLRYAFARKSVLRYLSLGMPYSQTLTLTANDLGHGDRRGRFVENTYLQGMAIVEEYKKARKEAFLERMRTNNPRKKQAMLPVEVMNLKS